MLYTSVITVCILYLIYRNYRTYRLLSRLESPINILLSIKEAWFSKDNIEMVYVSVEKTIDTKEQLFTSTLSLLLVQFLPYCDSIEQLFLKKYINDLKRGDYACTYYQNAFNKYPIYISYIKRRDIALFYDHDLTKDILELPYGNILASKVSLLQPRSISVLWKYMDDLSELI